MRCYLVTIRSKRTYEISLDFLDLVAFFRERKENTMRTWVWRLGNINSLTFAIFPTARKLFKQFSLQMPLPSEISVTDILRESRSDPESGEERATTETTVIKYLVQHQCPILITSDRFFSPSRIDMHPANLLEQATTPVTATTSLKLHKIGVETCVRMSSAESCLGVPMGISSTDEITRGCCNCEWKISLLRVTLEW